MKGFKIPTEKKLEDTYGGFAWFAAFIPIAIQAILGAVVSFRASNSDKGHVKYMGLDAQWDNYQEKKPTKNSTVYYTY